MVKIVKELFKMIREIREVSKANNELLGFICQKISSNDSVKKDYIDIDEFMTTSLEMSEMFEKYDIMPDEFGIS